MVEVLLFPEEARAAVQLDGVVAMLPELHLLVVGTTASMVVGVLRKSMVHRVIGSKPATALSGTTALHAQLLQHGADILRVHDVKEAVETLKIFLALEGIGQM